MMRFSRSWGVSLVAGTGTAPDEAAPLAADAMAAGPAAGACGGWRWHIHSGPRVKQGTRLAGGQVLGRTDICFRAMAAAFKRRSASASSVRFSTHIQVAGIGVRGAAGVRAPLVGGPEAKLRRRREAPRDSLAVCRAWRHTHPPPARVRITLRKATAPRRRSPAAPRRRQPSRALRTISGPNGPVPAGQEAVWVLRIAAILPFPSLLFSSLSFLKPPLPGSPHRRPRPRRWRGARCAGKSGPTNTAGARRGPTWRAGLQGPRPPSGRSSQAAARSGEQRRGQGQCPPPRPRTPPWVHLHLHPPHSRPSQIAACHAACPRRHHHSPRRHLRCPLRQPAPGSPAPGPSLALGPARGRGRGPGSCSCCGSCCGCCAARSAGGSCSRGSSARARAPAPVRRAPSPAGCRLRLHQLGHPGPRGIRPLRRP
jgi:hypothetical protein